METTTMGRVVTEATIESLTDLWEVQGGIRLADRARRIVVAAQVDADTTLLSLPSSMIQRLGLSQTKCRHVTRNGVSAVMYEAVRLTILGRTCTMDVLEVPDGVPVLIGQIPLEHLDLVVDPHNRTLIGNPAHGGEHIYEMY